MEGKRANHTRSICNSPLDTPEKHSQTYLAISRATTLSSIGPIGGLSSESLCKKIQSNAKMEPRKLEDQRLKTLGISTTSRYVQNLAPLQVVLLSRIQSHCCSPGSSNCCWCIDANETSQKIRSPSQHLDGPRKDPVICKNSSRQNTDPSSKMIMCTVWEALWTTTVR